MDIWEGRGLGGVGKGPQQRAQCSTRTLGFGRGKGVRNERDLRTAADLLAREGRRMGIEVR